MCQRMAGSESTEHDLCAEETAAIGDVISSVRGDRSATAAIAAADSDGDLRRPGHGDFDGFALLTGILLAVAADNAIVADHVSLFKTNGGICSRLIDGVSTGRAVCGRIGNSDAAFGTIDQCHMYSSFFIRAQLNDVLLLDAAASVYHSTQ